MAAPAIPFGERSTASEVLEGLDLRGRTMLLTGCNSGIGFETLRALTGRGAHIVALARSETAAREACARSGGETTAIACDLSDLASVRQAVEVVRGLGRPLDAVIANAGIMGGSAPERLYGVEKQFLVNHVAHFLLVTSLMELVPDRSGRIVIVSSRAGIRLAPGKGILFDNLDAHRDYSPLRFYGHSKLANALFACELARRLAARGIAVNSLHPGVIFGTRLMRHLPLPFRFIAFLAQRFTKSEAQGAATQVLLAASPLVEGLTGQYWSDCRPAKGSRFLSDSTMASRLWSVTEEILARASAA